MAKILSPLIPFRAGLVAQMNLFAQDPEMRVGLKQIYVEGLAYLLAYDEPDLQRQEEFKKVVAGIAGLAETMVKQKQTTAGGIIKPTPELTSSFGSGHSPNFPPGEAS